MMKQGVRGFSLFSRLLFVLLSVVIIVSSVLTTAFYVYSRQAVEERTDEYVLQQFSTVSYHFRYELRNALVKDLQLLSSNPIIDDYLMATSFEREVAARAVERFFQESLRFSRSYESIALTDRAGMERIKVDWSGRAHNRRSFGEHPFFKRVREAQPGSVDVETPRIDANGSLVFSAAIHKTDPDIGKFGGTVVISHNLKEFVAYLDRLTIFDENPIWLLTPDGTVLKQPRTSRATLDPRPFLERGFFRDPVQVVTGGGMLVYQDLSINPDRPFMRLVISIPSAMLLHDTQRVVRFFLIVSAASLLVSSLLAYVLARYLSRPISEVVVATTRVASGDLTARVREASSGELHLLTDGFNRMAENLEKTTVSKEYVDNIVGSMMDALIVVSPDGLIRNVNAAALFLLGYEEAELTGRPFDLVVAEGPETGSGMLHEVLNRGSISTVEKTYRTKQGRSVPVLFSASVMRDSRNSVQGVVCVAQDMTELKQAEEQLQVFSRELQEINEELKNFAYTVSHDLRAPLVNIKGFSHELERAMNEIGPCFEKHMPMLGEDDIRKISPLMQRDIPEALSFIHSSVNRMDDLINAILQLSRAGRRKLNPETVRTEDLVYSILASLAHQIDDHKARVTVRDLPDVVADKTALEQIFGNLLDNAVKYLEPGRDGAIEVFSEQTDLESIFHVRDNGRGMMREDIPKAFEMFRRVGRQNVPGEGMGLAYVRTLVRLLGGRIWCESEQGKGTMFSFSLPRQTGA